MGQECRKGCPEMIPPEATTGGPPTPTILWSRERKSMCQGLKGDMGWSWSQAISHKKQSEAPPVRGTERNQGGWRARGLCSLTGLFEPFQRYSPDVTDLYAKEPGIADTACRALQDPGPSRAPVPLPLTPSPSTPPTQPLT